VEKESNPANCTSVARLKLSVCIMCFVWTNWSMQWQRKKQHWNALSCSLLLIIKRFKINLRQRVNKESCCNQEKVDEFLKHSGDHATGVDH